MITKERLMQVCLYRPDTGQFTGLIDRGRLYKVGMPFGREAKKGYLQVTIDGRTYQLHRLAWLYVYGEWPISQVDHKNLNPADNRISNLRLAAVSEQNCNRSVSRRSALGIKGVSYSQDLGKYRAAVQCRGKTVFDRLYDCVDDAVAAVSAARKLHHREFSRD